ncbi:MAG: hypothetical protein V3S98_10215, partial [Dehalococcoidia bacterium]
PGEPTLVGNGAKPLAQVLIAAAAVAAIVASASITFVKVGDSVIASRDAAQARVAELDEDYLRQIELINRAVEREAGATPYRLAQVTAFDRARAVVETDEERLRLMEGTLTVLEAGVAYNDMSFLVVTSLADHQAELAVAGYAGYEEDAIANYRRAAALFPNHWQPLRNLAIGLNDLYRPSEALEVVRQVTDIVGEEELGADLLWTRANTLLKLSDVDGAMESLLLALERSPSPLLELQINLQLSVLGYTPPGSAPGS